MSLLVGRFHCPSWNSFCGGCFLQMKKIQYFWKAKSVPNSKRARDRLSSFLARSQTKKGPLSKGWRYRCSRFERWGYERVLNGNIWPVGHLSHQWRNFSAAPRTLYATKHRRFDWSAAFLPTRVHQRSVATIPGTVAMDVRAVNKRSKSNGKNANEAYTRC